MGGERIRSPDGMPKLGLEGSNSSDTRGGRQNGRGVGELKGNSEELRCSPLRVSMLSLRHQVRSPAGRWESHGQSTWTGSGSSEGSSSGEKGLLGGQTQGL